MGAIFDRAVRPPWYIRGIPPTQEELASFERAVVAARSGVPSVVLVGGDAGIGKSTLVEEAALRSGVSLYLGRSVHIGGDATGVVLRRFHFNSEPDARCSQLTQMAVTPRGRR
jgi:hypothetical protein